MSTIIEFDSSYCDCHGANAITSLEIIDHCCHDEQYFQGCGRGKFKNVVTGIGCSAKEAVDNALEQVIMTSKCPFLPSKIKNELTRYSHKPDANHPNVYHYVSIRWN